MQVMRSHQLEALGRRRTRIHQITAVDVFSERGRAVSLKTRRRDDVVPKLVRATTPVRRFLNRDQIHLVVGASR